MIPVKNEKPASSQTPDHLQFSLRWQKPHWSVITSCLGCRLSAPGKGCSCQWLPKPCGAPSFCLTVALGALIAGYRLAVFVARSRLQAVEDSGAIPASQTGFTQQQSKIVVNCNSPQYS